MRKLLFILPPLIAVFFAADALAMGRQARLPAGQQEPAPAAVAPGEEEELGLEAPSEEEVKKEEKKKPYPVESPEEAVREKIRDIELTPRQ